MRQSYHVELAAGSLELAVEPRVVVGTLVDVHDHLCLGQHLVNGLIAGIAQRDVARIAGRARLVPVYFSVVPDHALPRLVAHLHPTGLYALVFQCLQHVARVVGHGFLQFVHRVAGPCRRLVLATRIGEEVAVVEVDEQAQSLLVGASGLGQHVGLVAPCAVGLLRVHPHAQADGVHANLLHQRHHLGLLAGGVVESFAVGFHLATPADVGTAGKLVGGLCPGRNGGQQGQQG